MADAHLRKLQVCNHFEKARDSPSRVCGQADAWPCKQQQGLDLAQPDPSSRNMPVGPIFEPLTKMAIDTDLASASRWHGAAWRSRLSILILGWAGSFGLTSTRKALLGVRQQASLPTILEVHFGMRHLGDCATTKDAPMRPPFWWKVGGGGTIG